MLVALLLSGEVTRQDLAFPRSVLRVDTHPAGAQRGIDFVRTEARATGQGQALLIIDAVLFIEAVLFLDRPFLTHLDDADRFDDAVGH